MRPLLALPLLVTICLSARLSGAQTSAAGSPVATFRGHIVPNDRWIQLSLFADNSAAAVWVGSAGRRNEFRGTYTSDSTGYAVKLKADPGADQYYQSLNLTIRARDGQHYGDWTSERQRASRPITEISLVPVGSPLTPDRNSRVEAPTRAKKPVVGVIRSGGHSHARLSRQAAAVKRVVNRGYRTSAKRIARAVRRNRKIRR